MEVGGLIEATLRTVLSFPKRSALVSTFVQPNPDPASPASKLAKGSGAAGEPWLSFFTPDELGAMLRSLGFSDASFLSPEEAERRYYANRTDGLPAPARVSIVTARV